MSSCCTLRLNRRRAFSRDSPSCSRISAKQTHLQTRPEGPNSYYKDLTGSQVGGRKGSVLICQQASSTFFVGLVVVITLLLAGCEAFGRHGSGQEAKLRPALAEQVSVIDPAKGQNNSLPAVDFFINLVAQENGNFAFVKQLTG